jgi:ABC-2 type transport system permease protein
LANLIFNEWIKLSGKKRLLVILLIVAALVGIFTYAQYQAAIEFEKRFGKVDWREALELRIEGWESRMKSPRVSEEDIRELSLRIAQNQYYLDNDINPAETGAPTFVRNLIENSTNLLLPLLVMIIAADLVSSEHSAGTIKVLLTRPIRRWKILLSKYITLMMAVSLIVMLFTALAAAISGAVFGFAGWDAPVLTGFSSSDGELLTNAVRSIPQWQYIVLEVGLAWAVCMTVATISFMLSVIIRSTAAGMGVMLAALIAGLILQELVASWESAKYLFMVNLELIDYLEEAVPPIAGMNLEFSLTVLAVWAAAALIVSFAVFTRRDVY